MGLIGALWPTSSDARQVTAHPQGGEQNAFGTLSKACQHVSASSDAYVSERFPSTIRPVSPVNRSGLWMPAGGEPRKKSSITAEPNASRYCYSSNHQKGIYRCSKLLGSSPQSQLSASRHVSTPTSSAASPAQPQALSSLARPALIPQSAQSPVALSASPARTTRRFVTDKISRPSGRLTSLDRRRDQSVPAAVLHSKDPCACSRRS